MTQELRWRYRFDNFSRAHTLLRQALDDGVEPLNDLELEGVIQRFEYTFELSWNVLKDRLEYDGVTIAPVTPRQVIREAFQAKLIDDCDTWIDMLTDRNLMSHTYDSERFQAVVRNIHSRYLAILDALYQQLIPDILQQ